MSIVYVMILRKFLWLVRVTLVATFGFLALNFEKWWGPTNDGFTQK